MGLCSSCSKRHGRVDVKVNEWNFNGRWGPRIEDQEETMYRREWYSVDEWEKFILDLQTIESTAKYRLRQIHESGAAGGDSGDCSFEFLR